MAQPALSTTATSLSNPLHLPDHGIHRLVGTTANYSFVFVPGTLTIQQATPTITVGTSGSPSNYGSPVTFTATVTTGDTNLVTFYSGATVLGTATPSNGAAMLTTSSLALGSYTITASIAAGGNYTNASTTSGITQTVNQASSSITTNPTASAITYGQALSASTLSGGVGSPAGGTFSWTSPTTIPQAGSPTESITYTPGNTTDYSPVIGSIPVTVNKATPTATLGSSPNPSSYGTSVTFTASLAAVSGGVLPTGTVTFKNGATTLCSAVSLSGGSANCATTTLIAPSDSIIAVYSGDSNYNTATSSNLTQTVNQASSSITTNPTASAITYGQALSASTLSGGVGSPAGGTFSWTSPTTIPQAGTPTESITYTPTNTTDYSPATGSISVTVNKATPTATLGSSPNPSSYGTSVTFTASLAAVGGGVLPTGTVTFKNGATTLCSAVSLSGGSATCATTALPAPSDSIIAVYSGDSNYNTATSSTLTQTVNQASSSITSNPTASAITYGQALSASTLSGGVGSPAGGTFSWTMPTTIPQAGTPSESITYTPTNTADYGTATGSISVTVNKASQTISFSSYPSSAPDGTSFTVAATGGASGNPVTFTSSGVCSNSRGATYTMTAGTGTCSVIANQASNSNYLAAPQLIVTVTATSGPVITVSPSSINFGAVAVGSISTKTVTVSNTGNAAATISTPRISLLQASNSNEFVMVNLCPSSLAAGKSCTITVSFVAGAYYSTPQTATLQVMDNAPGSPQPVALSATILIPQTITFTGVPSSAVYNSSFTVTATGGASGNPVILHGFRSVQHHSGAQPTR